MDILVNKYCQYVQDLWKLNKTGRAAAIVLGADKVKS